MSFRDDMPISEARVTVRAERAERDGLTCPVCDQHVQEYSRSINSGMAVSLIKMYRAAGLGWQHVPTTVGGKSREEGKLRYWGLVEELEEPREDGGRAGWWRVTALGRDWLFGRITVPRYAQVFNKRRLRLHGEPWRLADALGDQFDLRELMAGLTPPPPETQNPLFG